MSISMRSYLTASVSLVGAAAVALSPTALVAEPPGTDLVAASSAQVDLTAAADDFLAPWVSAFNTASTGATKMSKIYAEGPGAPFQQMIVNQVNFADTLLNDPGCIR